MERATHLHDKLVGSTPLHASPCEHVVMLDRRRGDKGWEHGHQHGNITGWPQYRRMLLNECCNHKKVPPWLVFSVEPRLNSCNYRLPEGELDLIQNDPT
jgi:hypothetical protein